ncbi:hypothetical protein IH824_20415 [candidate division KSB1 bacterium]|nr:hypothetical protein [candidate division KSB1 bacterium]
MKKIFLILLAVIALSIHSIYPQLKNELRKNLDEYMTRLTELGYSGALLVAKEGKVIFSKGYGLANRTEQTPVTPETIFTTPLRGTHPSATVRIGHLLDLNLQTEIKGLYACDASTFPEALGQPTVLTIIGLAKRLAKHLIGADSIHEKRHASRQA